MITFALLLSGCVLIGSFFGAVIVHIKIKKMEEYVKEMYTTIMYSIEKQMEKK